MKYDLSRNPGVIALLGSVSVHAALAAWLWLHEPVSPPRPPAPVELEFSLLEPTPAPALDVATSTHAEPASSLAAATPGTPPRASKRPSSHTPPMPTPNEVALPSADPLTQDDPAPVQAAPARVVSASPARRTDLSPLAAALTMRDAFDAPSRCAAALPDAGCAPGADVPAAQRANDPHELVIALRKELALEPQKDGSYVYQGAALRATLRPDGQVEFEDKIRDLNSLAERLAGVQQNVAEKRRFMHSSARLRAQLVALAEAKNQARGRQNLQHALDQLWKDAARSVAQKRAALFALWDDCANDDSGSAAQATIESFVRSHLPEGSALAYSAIELEQLNRRRISRRSFEPYALLDAGPRPG